MNWHVTWHVTDNMMVRQGYVCVECGCVKDGYDPEVGGWVSSRWCHNYRGHKTRGRRRMRPIAIKHEVVSQQLPAPPDPKEPSSEEHA